MNKTSVTTTEKTIIVDALIDERGTYGVFALSRIRISPGNRKRFNELALQELAASIKSMGVAQPILMRPVTPTAEQPEEFEIVAGERRFRASNIAGMADIPAMVRQLTDLQAAKLRILENLQREDPHEMEEAEGYQLLMQQHGYNADQLAEEVSKSRAYIYGRLKLCALTLPVREQFLDNKIPASTALLIARIPVPALQVRALDEIVNPKSWPNEPLSYRKAVEHIQSRYMLDLATAIFPLDSAKLLAAAGSCNKCPKRTGNDPVLYPGLSADVCTDPDCFSEKRAAQHAATLVAANKQGIPIFEGDEIAKIRQAQWSRDSEFVTGVTNLHYFERNAPTTGNAGSLSGILAGEQLPPVAAYMRAADDSLTPIYSRKAAQLALESIGACETVAVHAARMATVLAMPPTEKQIKDDAAATSAANKAEQITAYRIALYKKLRKQGGQHGFSLDSLREFVKLASIEFSLPAKDLADVYDFDARDTKAIAAHIGQAGLPEIQLLLVDMFVSNVLSVRTWELDECADDDFATVESMARHEGIDPEQLFEMMYPSSINLDAMQYADLFKFASSHPTRINELKDAVLSHKRVDLIPMLEKATTELGLVYAVGGFVPKVVVTPEPAPAAAPPDTSIESDVASPGAAGGPAIGDDAVDQAPVDESDDEHLAEAMVESKPPVKASKGAKKPPAKPTPKAAPAADTSPVPAANEAFDPASAWPFPKSSTAAMTKSKQSPQAKTSADTTPK
jgi:ParB/RepB/Spo0J family partition protein